MYVFSCVISHQLYLYPKPKEHKYVSERALHSVSPHMTPSIQLLIKYSRLNCIHFWRIYT